MTTARTVALAALLAVEREEAWANTALKKELARAGLDRRDAALATQLVFGVLQQRLLLDHYLAAFSKEPLRKLEPVVRGSLRMALYQLLFLERIPESAAVNEAVSAVRKRGKNPRAAGMTNAILRNILRNKETLPPPKGADKLATLALAHSHPRWLVEELARRLEGEELAALLALHNTAAPTYLQINSTRATPDAVRASLASEGVAAEPHPWLPDCLVVESLGRLEQLTAFREGQVYVQDPAAKCAILAASPQKGAQVLDLCAAPGGKSFAAAIAMGNEGGLLSCDIYPHKCEILKAGAARLGLSMLKTQQHDATIFCPQWEGRFDLVIADVPCSGLGVVRKKPEIRYKDPAPMRTLPALQQKILQHAASYVRPAGCLLYATCTLRPEENEELLAAFLQRHPNYQTEAFSLPLLAEKVEQGQFTFWPQRHNTDGFFIAKLRRHA